MGIREVGVDTKYFHLLLPDLIHVELAFHLILVFRLYYIFFLYMK